MFSFYPGKCIQYHIGAKPRIIRSKDTFTFVIESSFHNESVAMTALEKIYKYLVQTSRGSALNIPERVENPRQFRI